ncbi:hypothetical protein BN13_50038 [Nostocoides jenkinsii Ben 74]|uniref:Uncharacterized protein n=1 Tax=Nostocoides jenkinsii Ben 74 TaxID=1193518 RepID=A0A077MB59_9MICO|nr:hypothetical protein BN13_50038 [Tetrasphaera jenkinsii Ben 74]
MATAAAPALAGSSVCPDASPVLVYPLLTGPQESPTFFVFIQGLVTGDVVQATDLARGESGTGPFTSASDIVLPQGGVYTADGSYSQGAGSVRPGHRREQCPVLLPSDRPRGRAGVSQRRVHLCHRRRAAGFVTQPERIH